MKRVSVLGCGWLGMPFAKLMVDEGYIVKGSTTSTDKLEILLEKGINPYLLSVDETIEGNIDRFLDVEILMINIPFRKQKNFAKTYKALADKIEKSAIEKVIFISSTSVYPDVNTEVSEDDLVEVNPAKKDLFALEEIFSNHSGFETTIIRFAGLIGGHRNPGNFFKEGRIVENGLAPVNLIHLEDCIQILKTVIDKDVWKITLNACADSHPSRASYYTRAAEQMGKTPATFKEELNTFKIIRNQKLKKVLGYEFIYPDLIDGLEAFKF